MMDEEFLDKTKGLDNLRENILDEIILPDCKILCAILETIQKRFNETLSNGDPGEAEGIRLRMDILVSLMEKRNRFAGDLVRCGALLKMPKNMDTEENALYQIITEYYPNVCAQIDHTNQFLRTISSEEVASVTASEIKSWKDLVQTLTKTKELYEKQAAFYNVTLTREVYEMQGRTNNEVHANSEELYQTICHALEGNRRLLKEAESGIATFPFPDGMDNLRTIISDLTKNKEILERELRNGEVEAGTTKLDPSEGIDDVKAIIEKLSKNKDLFERHLGKDEVPDA